MPPKRSGDSATLRCQLLERLDNLCGYFKVVEAPQLSPIEEIKRPYEDHWIEVQVDLPTDNDREKRNYWALLRETLTMISAMAVVHYDECIELLTGTANMKIPADFDLTEQRLHMRFILDFTDRQKRRDLECDRAFQRRYEYSIALFGRSYDDDHSWRHLEVLFQRETSARVSRAISEALNHGEIIKPIVVPVRINLKPHVKWASTTEQATMLQQLTDTLAKALTGSRGQPEQAVRVTLASIDLDLERLDRHTVIFEATTALVETGVIIDPLRVPASPYSNRGDEETNRAVASARLHCAICNNSNNKARVRGFIVPRDYTWQASTYEPFFSAVAASRGLKTLYLQSMRGGHNDVVLMWLAYALFSKQSTTSVEILQTTPLPLDPSFVDRWTSVIEADNPACLLLAIVEETQLESTCSTARPITLSTGTLIQRRHLKEAIRLPCRWDGVVVDDDPTQRTIHVLLPGFGFCVIDREALPSKRVRVASDAVCINTSVASVKKAPLRQLLVRFSSRMMTQGHNDANCEAISRLLGLIGRDLTTLSLGYFHLSDDNIVQCLVNCSHLQTLHVYLGTFNGASGVLQLYSLGYRIESLDFASISSAALDTLLDAVVSGSPHPIQKALKKLRVRRQSHGVIQESSVERLVQVARCDGRISHLRIHRFGQNDDLRWNELSSLNGHVKLQAESFPLASKYSFLMAMQSRNQINTSARLNEDTIALVFEYAAPIMSRSVVVETNPTEQKWW